MPVWLVSGLSEGTRLVDEEPFGPILPIIKYEDVDDAVRQANANPNGLGASVWSKDIEKAKQIGELLESGTLWINDHGAIQPDMLFGGVKQSGFGVEFGSQGLAEFTSIQSIKINRC